MRELKSGAVFIHVDGKGLNHYGVLLSMSGRPGYEKALCVFFTSRPVHGAKHVRRATRDEIALAGMFTNKTTYLVRAIRDPGELEPTGATFSDDRRRALFLEFFDNGYAK